MSEFYSPYQFMPVTGKINGKKVVQDYELLKEGKAKENPQARHDLWHKQGRTGRIICSLYLNSPTVVGNEHVPDEKTEKKRIQQYKWQGQAALPANTIKGMISSLAEALSQSALRVLDADKDKKMRVPDELAQNSWETKKVPVPNTVYEYFDHIDSDLKPWQEKRNNLTPAEILFGAVEVNEQDEASGTGRSLGGRVRFSDAISDQPVKQMPEVTLKLLSEPRTPCPAMYYHVEDHRGEYLSKNQMHQFPENKQIFPNGRKFYLHHPLRQKMQRFWESPVNTSRDKHKFLCSPLEEGQTFYFHLDFHNLSEAELGLLVTAINPSSTFQNKIGLGKGLGLGSVSVKIEGIFYKDQVERYHINTALQANRYQQAWQAEASLSSEALSNLYPKEFINGYKLLDKPDNQDLVDQDTLKIINTIGNPDKMDDDLLVRNPILLEQEDTPETETFKWFNENDKHANQALPKIIPNIKIPYLYADMNEAIRSGDFRKVTIAVTKDIEDKPAEPEEVSDAAKDVFAKFFGK